MPDRKGRDERATTASVATSMARGRRDKWTPGGTAVYGRQATNLPNRHDLRRPAKAVTTRPLR